MGKNSPYVLLDLLKWLLVHRVHTQYEYVIYYSYNIYAVLCSFYLVPTPTPTNHLDLDAVSGLAKAIKEYEGGVVLVSHDFRLIDQVAQEIWVCENKGVTKYTGDIRSYKKILAKKMEVHKVTTR